MQSVSWQRVRRGANNLKPTPHTRPVQPLISLTVCKPEATFPPSVRTTIVFPALFLLDRSHHRDRDHSDSCFSIRNRASNPALRSNAHLASEGLETRG